ncbi:MAG: SDR family NAD(P)-dependent oxidoreductase [Desulfobacterales bacterium]|nr:SDR family NAD(P)-dependent oxidoreductase [Desulfobacterales bacterium]
MLTRRTFTDDDQRAFAELSGDRNPIHLDPVLARRLLFGRPVVHGLHALLWSLDSYLEDQTMPIEFETLKAKFQTGIGVGQMVRSMIREPDESRIAIQLETDDALAAWFEVNWSASRQSENVALPATNPDPPVCRGRLLADVANAAGHLELYLDRDLAGSLLPNLNRLLPTMQLAALLATTRLVGMECPGHHSIYSALNLDYGADRSGEPKLNYRVANCNERLRLISMDVAAPGVKGRVDAFLRPEPRRQAATADIRRQVESEELASQRALVVGGSRGLGEVTAKILAAGGARVLLTYHRGKTDAARIVEDIIAHGAEADCVALDIRKTPLKLPDRFSKPSRPLYLYYFATPHIFGTAKGRFSIRRFTAFCEYYVSGFRRIVQDLVDRSSGLTKIFYPSSIAVEEIPLDMGEYAAAKLAGESLCDFLQKAHPGLIVHKPRLPRIATDQTVSLLPVKSQEPVSILLNELRVLRNL